MIEKFFTLRWASFHKGLITFVTHNKLLAIWWCHWGNLKSRAFPSFSKTPYTLLPSLCLLNRPSVSFYIQYGEFSKHTAYLIRTSIIIRSSTNHKQFSYTAGHCWRAHCFFKWCNFCPTIWKGIITLYTAKSVLPIIASDNIHLYVKCRKNNLISKSKLFICSVEIGGSLSQGIDSWNYSVLAQFSETVIS